MQKHLLRPFVFRFQASFMHIYHYVCELVPKRKCGIKPAYSPFWGSDVRITELQMIRARAARWYQTCWRCACCWKHQQKLLKFIMQMNWTWRALRSHCKHTEKALMEHCVRRMWICQGCFERVIKKPSRNSFRVFFHRCARSRCAFISINRPALFSIF